ncbi:MAG: lipid-A-disaccharide synthase [Armatimonadetes bacterium]|nr:lipid-A-disaccharide synthase [Armatimonadota bacterium]
MNGPRLGIVAGEASGDLHGAALVAELKRQRPDLRFIGIGGRRLREAGVDIRFDSTGWGAIGIVESLRLIPGLLRIFARWKRVLRAEKPAGLILIDFGAFNIRVARFAREEGLRVFYYFPPGSWRRQPGRLEELAALTDIVVTPFPWHARHLKEAGANAHFFGHPALDVIRPASKEDFCRETGLNRSHPIVALLPGSRIAEVSHTLEVMLRAAALIGRQIPGVQYLVPASSHLALTKLRRQADAWNRREASPIHIVEGRAHDCLNAAGLAIIVSGTATLEAAVLNTPMIIIYRGSWLMELEYKIRKPKFDHVGMPNILADQRICPELIQHEATPERIAELAVELLGDPTRAQAALKDAVACLGGPGAVEKTARLLVQEWLI